MFDDDVRRLIEKEAAAAKIPAHHLLAVVEVESAGKAYAMVKGRKEPLIRWEGHYFDRLLSPADRAIARKQGLASPKAGGVANPNGQPARYALLDRAILIDAKAAFESCSWGVGQVMGSHWKSLGYSSVEALVTEARRDVGGQVRLMVKFIVENNLLDEIRSGAWAKFARAYNGPAYKKNAYDTKMAKAAARWAKAKPLTATGKPADAPKPPPAPAVVLTPQPTPAPVPVAPIADLTGDAALIANPVSEVLTSKYPAPDPMPNGKSLTAKQKIVYAVQAWLKELNYNPGGLDGKDGPLTASAIRDARADNGLIEGDQIDILFIDGDKSHFDTDFYTYMSVMSPKGIVFMHDITDDAPGAAYRRVCSTGFRHSEIIDKTDSVKASWQEEAGEPAKSPHEGWLRHWKGSSCGVGVIYMPDHPSGRNP